MEIEAEVQPMLTHRAEENFNMKEERYIMNSESATYFKEGQEDLSDYDPTHFFT